MALGRLFHYAFDAVMVSTVLAGIRRSSGFTYVCNKLLDCLLIYAQPRHLFNIRLDDAQRSGHVLEHWRDGVRSGSDEDNEHSVLQEGLEEWHTMSLRGLWLRMQYLLCRMEVLYARQSCYCICNPYMHCTLEHHRNLSLSALS